MKKNILYLLLFFTLMRLSGQELNCQVQIFSQQIQGTDNKRIFDNLQKQIFEFMNNTKWTKDQFLQQEKIECSILINITEKVSSDAFKATIQVQSRRPIYKSSYNSPVFNYNDQRFEFNYVEFQPFEFNMNNFTSNLTSILAYYAYVIIAIDYDTYAPLGGTEYWKAAQQVVTNAQTANETGWKAFETQKNRFWLVDNILNPVYQPIRDTWYRYHRKGLDIMFEKTEEGRAEIFASLNALKEVHKNRPASFNMQLFFEAKMQEVINIFQQGTNEEKTEITETLNLIDPANTIRYAKILGQ